MSSYKKKIQTLIHQAEPLGSSPEAEDNAEVKRKQSAEEVGHFVDFVGFRGISWDFVGFRGIFVGFRGIFDIR